MFQQHFGNISEIICIQFHIRNTVDEHQLTRKLLLMQINNAKYIQKSTALDILEPVHDAGVFQDFQRGKFQ